MGDPKLSDLVRSAQGGDGAAFEGIVRALQRRVFQAVLAMTGSMEEADEVTQEAFIRLYERLGSIREPRAVSGWVVRTALNVARSRKRFAKIRGWLGAARKAPEGEPSLCPSPESQAALHEMGAIVEAWSEARLSDAQRVVMQLRVGEQMTFEEIARELGISASAAKAHFARARDKLRAMEARHGGVR